MKLQVLGRAAYCYSGGRRFNATQPTVVFIHGAGHDHSAWSLHARWFAHHGCNALAVDLPGHGLSAGPFLPDVQAYGAWVLALLQALPATAPLGRSEERQRPAALVGHSMGSLIALEAAAQQPARIKQLVMVGTAYPMAVSEALLNTARQDPLAAMKMVNAWSIASLASKPSHPGPGVWLHGAGLALSQQVQARAMARSAPGEPAPNAFLHGFEVCHAYRNGLQAASTVQARTHFILGKADQMTPPKATGDLASALKATVSVVPSGHLMMAEAPDAVLAALRQALR